ncbi:MAG: ABC transporter substrate-binding protein, partial [Alistipes sp.]|nr:ABC transporter substrate-binding protein [Alistipes sp.]
VTFRALNADETLDVALLLPLSAGSNAARNNYVEFYEGFLLGLEDVKAKGYSVDLTLFDTSHDYVKTAETVSDPRFRRAKLIVGPVYEDELLPVLQFAESNAVPVVSPLANIAATGSSVLFQMAPDTERKHDKLAGLFAEGKHVTLIYTDNTDKDFESEIFEMLGGRAYSTYNYTYMHHRTAARRDSDPSDMTQLLQNGQDNVFVVMSNNETEVDRILAAIASANAGLVSRGHTAPQFVVIGNPKWHRYNTIDRSIFFKDRVSMVSTYHAKRDSEAIRRFDSRFAEAFGALPSLYAYRGYDAAVVFCSGMFSDIEYGMEGRRYRPLQTVYNFKRTEGGSRVNTEWMRVN